MSEPTPDRISRDDIENKLMALKGSVDQKTSDAKGKLVTAGVAGGVILLLLMYILGKRVGTKKSTIVEIRRV